MSVFSKLAGKVAIVTGGSKGIGRATALSLARQGANVVVNYSSDSAAAESVVSEIGANRAIAVQGDAGKIADIEKLVAATVERFGKIDIVVANAGVLPMKDLEHTTEDDFDKTFELNVKGPYFLVQKSAPHMSAGSHVILISTSLCTASTVQPPYLLYNATKGAIEQMVRVLSKDLGRRQISVNCVAPGPTGTELFLRGKPEPVLKMIAGFSPQNRIGEPDEIAEVIAFLSASSWVSGQTVRVNGGMA